MPLIAVQGCQIVDTVHQGTCTITSGLSTNTKIDGKPVCLDGLIVTVAGGTIPGTQTAPVQVTINAKTIMNVKFEGKGVLAMGEQSNGTEMGTYSVPGPTGPTLVTAPITLQIVDAGQTDVQGS